MEKEFYASIKLVSGEEIFCLVSASEEEDRTLLVLDNPVIITPMTHKNGMIVDFKAIKNIVNTLDHAYLNKFIPQPTAENIAKFLLDSILHCYRVEVQESEGSMVAYEV